MTEVLDFDNLLNNIKENTGKNDIYNVINKYLDRKNIDLTTRLNYNELDKICLALFFGYKLSVGLNLEKLKNNTSINFIKDENDIIISDLQSYVLMNLGLRLSLDGKSRDELNNLFISLISNELARLKLKDNSIENNNQER